ncbi:MAG: hypothetical protein QS98_C0005G0070 [archaeon GW2011_AR3]|nr:MAG: hypothetical protein QS98_C0005G0070 [archaeon GW2011_AR3]
MLQQGQGEKEKMRSNKFQWTIAMVLIVALLSQQSFAADPGHGAAAIASGTFESGNYTFPDSLFITNYFGIGSTYPSFRLTVAGNANISGTLNLSGVLSMAGNKIIGLATPTADTDAATKAYVDSQAGGGGSGSVNGSGTAGYLALWNGTNEINSSTIYQSAGLIGIGTTGPAHVLDVRANDSTNNAVTDVLSVWHGTTGTAEDGIGTAIIMNAQRASGTWANVGRISAIITDATNLDTAITFQTRKNAGIMTERLRIDSDGKVGINTSNATQTLQIQGTFNASPGGTTGLMVDSSGKVGIGTSAPIAPLTIITSSSTNGVLINNTAANQNTFLIMGTADAAFAKINVGRSGLAQKANALNIEASGDINFYPGSAAQGSEVLVLDSSGNVGIGTNITGSKLVVSGTLNATNIVLATNCADDQVLKWSSGVGTCGSDSGGAGTGSVNGSGAAGYIALWNSSGSLNSSVMVQSTGLIGIDTSGPDAKLDILSSTTDQLRLTFADGSSYTTFLSDTNGDLTITPTGGDVTVAGTAAGVTVDSADNADFSLDRAATNRGARVRYATGGGATEWSHGLMDSDVAGTGGNEFYIATGDGATNRVVIETSGEFGINTTNPTSALEVRGTLNVSGNATGPGVLFVDGSGNVSIGPINYAGSGGAKLRIYGDDRSVAGPHLQFHTTADTHPVAQLLAYSHNNTGLVFDAYWAGSWKSSSTSNFALYKYSDLFSMRYAKDVAAGGTVTWSDGLTLDKNGNVGINTTTPSYTLHLKGTLNVTGSGSGSGLLVDGTGNVGIGIAPSTKLHISGGNIRSEVASGGDGFEGYSSSTHLFSMTRSVNSLKLASWDDLVFEVGATSGPGTGTIAMVINNSGTVGIGTSSPKDTLHVQGSARVTANLTSGPLNVTPGYFNQSLDGKTDAVMVWQTGASGTGAIYSGDGSSMRNILSFDAANDDITIGQAGTVLIDKITLSAGTDDEVVITGNLTVEAIAFESGTNSIFVNASGCIIIQSTNTIDATCP